MAKEAENQAPNAQLKQYLIDEFVEDYQKGHLSRREALGLLGGLVGATSAATLLTGCGPAESPVSPTSAAPSVTAPEPPVATASAQASPSSSASASVPQVLPPQSPLSVAATDPSIVSTRLEAPIKDGRVIVYLTHPPADKSTRLPVVLVCHENRGLTPHIEDVTRRLAKAGYVGAAIDLLSDQGGTAAVADQASIPGLLGALSDERIVEAYKAALTVIKTQGFARGDRVGMVGFCFGGGVTWKIALAIPELRAAVPFYGPPPAEAELAKVKANVLAIYAGKDARINDKASYVEPALKKTGKPHRVLTYPDVDHAFHNDTSPRYNEKAATEAWTETLSWFDKWLKKA